MTETTATTAQNSSMRHFTSPYAALCATACIATCETLISADKEFQEKATPEFITFYENLPAIVKEFKNRAQQLLDRTTQIDLSIDGDVEQFCRDVQTTRSDYVDLYNKRLTHRLAYAAVASALHDFVFSMKSLGTPWLPSDRESAAQLKKNLNEQIDARWEHIMATAKASHEVRTDAADITEVSGILRQTERFARGLLDQNFQYRKARLFGAEAN